MISTNTLTGVVTVGDMIKVKINNQVYIGELINIVEHDNKISCEVIIDGVTTVIPSHNCLAI